MAFWAMFRGLGLLSYLLLGLRLALVKQWQLCFESLSRAILALAPTLPQPEGEGNMI